MLEETPIINKILEIYIRKCINIGIRSKCQELYAK